jgi:LPS sulfotransferase NodH
VDLDKRALRKSLSTNFQPGPRHRLNRVILRTRQAVHLPGLLTGAQIDKPIFIIGAPRSGTSILFSVLRSSSALAHWPGEAHEVWEADHHPALRGWESNALDAADADPETITRIRRSFFLVAGRKRLIDKTPRNALRVPFVDAIFPDGRFVFLMRDGRDNVNSLINAWRTPRYRTYLLPEPHGMPRADPRWWKFVLYPGWKTDTHGPLERVCARQWVASNEFALDAFEGLDPTRRIDVRYEDLVADPTNSIRSVCERAEIPIDERLLDQAKALNRTPINVVTPPEAGKWKRENPQEIAAIEDLIEPTMRRLGYAL